MYFNFGFLLENITTKINDQDVRIEKISDSLLVAQFSQQPNLKINEVVKIYIPKKSIALADFEVIRGGDKTVGDITRESLTTSLVNSNQFNVVERNELKIVLEELKLGSMGLVEPKKIIAFGKLLQADLLLNGTLVNLDDSWNINVRLINVATGLILTAFEETGSFPELKTISRRDSSNLNESFDGKLKPEWIMGKRDKANVWMLIDIDSNNGANGSPKSLIMSFPF